MTALQCMQSQTDTTSRSGATSAGRPGARLLNNIFTHHRTYTAS